MTPRAWRYTLLSWDFALGLLMAGLSFFTLALNEVVRQADTTRVVLLFEASASVGLVAVSLTALAILVAFLKESYVKLLEESIGLKAAFRPYKVISRVAGAAVLIAGTAALLWADLRWWAKAWTFSLASGAATWALVGTVQLVTITIKHGELRMRMPEIKEAARAVLEERSHRQQSAG
jgi:hypothetical protein